VRMAATRRLQEHGSEASEAIPALLAVLRDQGIGWRTHLAATEALAAIGETAIPWLRHIFERGEPHLRNYAAVALKEINKTPELLTAIHEELARTSSTPIRSRWWSWSFNSGDAPMEEAEMRARIRHVLGSFNAVAEAAIRRELAEPIDLGHSGRLQFEVCPHFFGVTLVQTEEEIVPDSAISDAVPSEFKADAEAADLDVFEGIAAELPAWLADRWQAVGGPNLYRPAYLLFHGGLYQPRFDLEQRRWCKVSEVWPG
jgi:hypothetical protein